MCLTFLKPGPKNDENNIYVRLKCLHFPFYGLPLCFGDFKPENTFGKMSKEEFVSMIEMITNECKDFKVIKYSYLLMAVFLILLHIIFPNFLILTSEAYQSPNVSNFIGIVLFLSVYTIFVIKISHTVHHFHQKIRKVIRAENCMKYINRGLCWKLDINKNCLHLNLNYQGSNNQYLIEEAINSHGAVEEYIPYFDLENGESQNMDAEAQYANHVKIGFLWLAGTIGFLIIIENLIFKYLSGP